MLGHVPRQPRFVKPYVYITKAGDTPRTIAGSFGKCPCRGYELVGANLDKPLAPCPAGEVYQTLAPLEAGTRLRVPATWPEPGSVEVVGGTVGDPNSLEISKDGSSIYGGADSYQSNASGSSNVVTTPTPAPTNISFVTTPLPQTGATNYGATIPAGGIDNSASSAPSAAPSLPVDALVAYLNGLGVALPPGAVEQAKVVFSWWPQLAHTLPPAPQPTTPMLPPPPNGAPPGGRMPTADEFMKLLASAQRLMDALKLTGEALANLNTAWSEVNWFNPGFAQIAGYAKATNQNVDAVWKSIQVMLDQITSNTGAGIAKPDPAAKFAPNFMTAQWGTPMIADGPLGVVGTDENADLTSLMSFPAAAACIAQNGARLAELAGLKECWQGMKQSQLVEVLCMTNEAYETWKVACTGKATVTESCPAGKVWNSTLQACVTPPSGTVVEEKKTDNTMIWIGVAGVALLLAGGIAIANAGTKE